MQNTRERTEQLASMLVDTRKRTIELVCDLGDEQMMGPQLRIVNPPLWEIGHLAWFQEYWNHRRPRGTWYEADGPFDPSILENADALPPTLRTRLADWIERGSFERFAKPGERAPRARLALGPATPSNHTPPRRLRLSGCLRRSGVRGAQEPGFPGHSHTPPPANPTPPFARLDAEPASVLFSLTCNAASRTHARTHARTHPRAHPPRPARPSHPRSVP